MDNLGPAVKNPCIYAVILLHSTQSRFRFSFSSKPDCFHWKSRPFSAKYHLPKFSHLCKDRAGQTVLLFYSLNLPVFGFIFLFPMLLFCLLSFIDMQPIPSNPSEIRQLFLSIQKKFSRFSLHFFLDKKTFSCIFDNLLLSGRMVYLFAEKKEREVFL